VNREFSTISSINLNDKSSWQDTCFITLDIDWCHDDVLADSINLLEEADVSATWFVTHETKNLNRLRTNHKFELGIHPNFNFLLNGEASKSKNSKNVLEEICKIVPEAKSVRSHSLTQNSYLLDLFAEQKITHDVNDFIPFHADIEVSPWVLWNGMYRVPFNWEDDFQIMYSKININQKSPNEIAADLNFKGLKIFNFHPIHVYLNTESLERYERTRPIHNKPKELKMHRYEGYGTRNKLIELINDQKKN
jgi:hypothetical protein